MRDQLITRVACRHLCQLGYPCQCGGKCKQSKNVQVEITEVEVDDNVEVEYQAQSLTQPLRTYGSWDEQIPGGLSQGQDPSYFDPDHLQKGQKVEMEHTNDPNVAKEIAMDHLFEDPKYYDKLEKIENRVAKRFLAII